MWTFLRDNRRWLLTGLLLTFGSSFGQTWFISLFAGEIRAEFDLSDGGWGAIYTLATLSSAALLVGRGALADTMPLSRLAPIVAILFSVAAVGMALGHSIWILGLSVFLLRFCGQGMFSHIAMTAMGRWFVATRGRAVSIAALGHSLGEVILPLPVVLLIGAIGWRLSWGVTAAVILVVVMPLLVVLLANDREPQGRAERDVTAGLSGRHWTRSEVLRHWLFIALLPLILTPGFIGTVVFFHQVHVSEIKGWSLAAMAPGYPAYAGATVAMMLIAGRVADAVGPERMLPFVLVPMGLGCLLLGPSESVYGWFAALALLGITQGIGGALWGTLLPRVYGTRHLGSIRALVTAAMVLSTAIGPGVTGLLIDRGIDFPDQGFAMAVWCFVLSAAMVVVLRRLRYEGSAAAHPG
ncbi:MFS transporter [Rhodobacterales bacterium HKCCE3408]|nr:MFS transporter [Rhodobacterales bacterium HKCCE3408]